MPRTRAWRVGGAIALLALLVAPALPGSTGGRVLAHAQLVASSPGSGAILPEPPTEIRLVFSEPLESQVTSLDVATQDGTPVLARAGKVDRTKLDEARLMFEQMLGYANHLGLYAEETGPTGEALGNFPQAFTHLSLISAAFNLDRILGVSD